MSILTKSVLTEMQIQKMTEAAFPGNEMESYHELTEGLCNAAYLVRLKDGTETVLKVAPPADAELMFYEQNMMETEVSSLKKAASLTEVPVPEVYYYDRSKTICPSEYFFMEKLQGQSLSACGSNLTEEEKHTAYYKVGRYSRELNQIEEPYFGYPGIPELQYDTMEELYMSLIEHTLEDGRKKDVNLGIDYDTVLEIVHKHIEVLKDVTKPYFVHWDIWDGNVFLKDGDISGIIDFERVLYADPLMEYYFSDGEASNPAYLDGYGKKKFSNSEKIRRHLYNVYLSLIQVVECPYRQYDNDWQYHWAKEALLKTLELLK